MASSQGQGCMMYVPVLVSNSSMYSQPDTLQKDSSSMFAQAEALEKESAQLKMKAQQLKLQENVSNIIATKLSQLDNDISISAPACDAQEIIDFVETPWPSPCTTPRKYHTPPSVCDSDAHEANSLTPPSIHYGGVPANTIQAAPASNTGTQTCRISSSCISMPSVPIATIQVQSAQVGCAQQMIATAACCAAPVLTALVPCNAFFCPMPSVVQPLDAAPQSQDMRTTLMMRNLPNDYSRDMVLELLECKGFSGRYDFFYLPVDFQTNSGLGYAFVNFITHGDAQQAECLLQGYCDWTIPSHKVLEVSWSELSQGLQANIDRYHNSSVLHPSVPEEFQPMLFSNGVRIPFPAPTKPIRQPRLKLGGCRRTADEDECANLVGGKSSLTPADRIKKTISVINSGDIAEIVSHARNTLSSKLAFLAPEVCDEMHTVGQVCTFHKRLHDAIPDLQVTLEHIGNNDQHLGALTWRVTCIGTQVKKFIPHLPIDALAKFALEVTVKHAGNGRPAWVCWNFGVLATCSNTFSTVCIEDVSADDLTEKELKHRSGDCQPCAYFAFRADGCRAGDSCEFCHLCSKSQAKSKKKAKAARIRAGEI